MEMIEPIQHYVDNISAINLARNHVSHGRSKHIEARFHFIRDQVNKRKIELSHRPTEMQEADILTKALKHDRFKELVQYVEANCGYLLVKQLLYKCCTQF
ncbi:copia protein [Trifolium pratense]|uniref:Copia protein n=1 Tax=Trifolium pratense TaxID=57577 RepID=A0A2K3L9I5_TRIPR|nr:copia protein [Trifolium pratense]